MKELRIVGHWRSRTGYSKHTRALLRSALLAGFDVEAIESDVETRVSVAVGEDGEYVQTTEEIGAGDWACVPPCQEPEVRAALANRVSAEAPTILLQLPDRLKGWEEYRAGPRIGYSMIECDTLPADIARNIDVELLLAPSRAVLDVFRRAVRIPVGLLSDCVDTRTFSGVFDSREAAPEGLTAFPFDVRPCFTFLYVGTTHERKHWREMIHAFAEEFSHGEACLVLKCEASSDMKAFVKACRSWGADIRIDDRDLTDEGMAWLYGECECLISPGSEGFGLPIVEAGLLERPAIALDGGGSADLISEGTGYPVAAVKAPAVGQNPRFFRSEANWWTFRAPEMRRAMREAYEDPWIGAKGRAAKEHMLRNFTCEVIAARLAEVIDDAWAVWDAGKSW